MFIESVKKYSEVLIRLKNLETLESLSDRELVDFAIAIHQLSKVTEQALGALKALILKRDIDVTYNIEENMKVFIGNGNGKNIADIPAIFKELNNEELRQQFFKACSLIQERVIDPEFKAIVSKHLDYVPGAEKTIVNIKPITKEEQKQFAAGLL